MDKSVPDPEPIRFRIRNRSFIKQGFSNIAMFEIFIEILMKDDERNVLFIHRFSFKIFLFFFIFILKLVNLEFWNFE